MFYKTRGDTYIRYILDCINIVGGWVTAVVVIYRLQVVACSLIGDHIVMMCVCVCISVYSMYSVCNTLHRLLQCIILLGRIYYNIYI